MKLIEVISCCAILVMCGAGFFFAGKSCAAVFQKTSLLYQELTHDSFVVGGMTQAVQNGTVSDFVHVCRSLWPDESMTVCVKTNLQGKTVYECEWTHLGKRKGTCITNGGDSE